MLFFISSTLCTTCTFTSCESISCSHVRPISSLSTKIRCQSTCILVTHPNAIHNISPITCGFDAQVSQTILLLIFGSCPASRFAILGTNHEKAGVATKPISGAGRSFENSALLSQPCSFLSLLPCRAFLLGLTGGWPMSAHFNPRIFSWKVSIHYRSAFGMSLTLVAWSS